jgi:hypothetical protein
VAKKDKYVGAGQTEVDLEHLKQRFDLLDQRLDNIDSMVTAVAERVTSRPVVLYVNCPKCGGQIQIDLMGNQKPTM